LNKLAMSFLALAIVGVLWSVPWMGNSDQVTLKAPPTGAFVQMFGTLDASADVAATFADRTTCTRLSEPIAVSPHGVNMSFYHLDCNGTIGYINVKWVR
jgi:hypothetical protein